MSKITLDADLKAKLNGLNEQIELCDEAGNILGHFLPKEMYREMFDAWVNAVFPEEKLEKARQDYRQRGGMTTAQAIAYLEEIIRKKQGEK